MESSMLPHLSVTHEKDITDLDTLECIRSVSECSMSGTSGYNSTTSPGPDNSSTTSSYSPVQSPATALQTEFSQLLIPPGISYHQNSLQYVQLQTADMSVNNINQQNNMNFSPHLINYMNQRNDELCEQQILSSAATHPYMPVKYEYEASLRITEQPVEKFRFRYKSEMHGTHGSLNGTNTKRNNKTFPEVELCGYKGPAIIRCSLFQTNLESPHSHQLVVRKDDHDTCDPHELKVSQEVGYFAEFKNMGIIHTAKKFIVEELLKKKRQRLGRDFLTIKEDRELCKQTEKEAKDMNLNQVRLCFEAFRIEDNNTYTPIAAPVYSNSINNRKSAQTGELRIVRLSIATGNVAGGDDLMLLVEKVSKKNIKVRFYEMVEDEQVWEAFASFRESDVHHQYAIVCRTPPYKDKGIDEAVEVFIELVRPSDDERSYPPVSFRYKPSYAAISRKRRRTYSSFNSNSSGSLSSGDIPKPVQEQNNSISIGCASTELKTILNNIDFNKSDMSIDSCLLAFLDDAKLTGLDEAPKKSEEELLISNSIEKDGAFIGNNTRNSMYHYKKQMISKKQMDIAKQGGQPQPHNIYLQRVLNIFQDTIRSSTTPNSTRRQCAAEQITKIIKEHALKYGDSLTHEIILSNNNRFAIPFFKMLDYFELHELLNTLVNKQTQSALHYACLYDQPNYIRPLLKLGCNPNIQDADGNTALHVAVAEKHVQCVQSFINSEMALNLNILNDDGFTPLHLAIRDNNYDIVAKLLKFDEASVKTQSTKDGSNALHMAVQQQNLELVNLITDCEHVNILISILYATNRAGYLPLDLAKQLVTSDEQGKQILNVLNALYQKYPSADKRQKMDVCSTDCDVAESHEIIIKEEENSCSSTEEDEEDNYSGLSTISNTENSPKPIVIRESEIKQEACEDNAASIVSRTDIETALGNKEVFSKLCVELDRNEKWKILAKEIELAYFYLTNAEAFLYSLKRNLKTIDCSQLILALERIDENLIKIIKN